jgi:uncharacterized protein
MKRRVSVPVPLASRRVFGAARYGLLLAGLLLVSACGRPESPETPPETPAAAATPDASPQERDSDTPGPAAADGAAAEVAGGDGTGERTNRLAQESSPYLQMHMHNPVDWYPWGPEAFDKARREDKLIFLSVGYSSCYWCHVMERESFMDDEIAAFLNEHFVCIKVDREERPDVDSIYMMAVQLLIRRGGWPMSVFLRPDGKPFFGGTYFPARDGDRPGSPGFLSVVRRLQEVWTTQRSVVDDTAERLSAAIQTEMLGPEVADDTPLQAELLDRLTAMLAAAFDEQYGGFGYSTEDPLRPKFPEASNLLFLLDRVERTGDEDCRRMLTVTLDRMIQGGIWDHIGGGFHRYSTDRYWKIPHFEKMLYDNGQLLSVYSRAYRLTGNERYRQIVDATVDFLLREMRDSEGAFYSALDAESEQVEGKFYRWTQEEIAAVLGDAYDDFAAVYGLANPPNFEHEYYVLQLERSLESLAQQQHRTLAELDAQLQPSRAQLLQARDQRVRPLTDDKILCSWNGLVIRGLADAGRYCDRPEYLQIAGEAADFVLARLRGEDGRLRRTYRDGQAKLNAYLDDYAFLVDGLIGLHEATDDARWLQHAEALTGQQIDLFWDEQRGGFFFTARDHEALIARSKQLTDDAQPAGNTVAAINLLYLARQFDRPEYRQRAEQTIRIALGVINEMPRAAPRMAVALATALAAHGNATPPEVQTD